MRLCWMALCVTCVLLSANLAFAAGDVTVEPLGRRGLLVVGDAAANDIVIEPADDDPSQIEIRGRDGTTVNGVFSWRVNRPQKLEIRMGDGDDVVALAVLKIRRKLRVDLGEGNDRCEFFAARLNGRTKIIGGPGDDVLTATGRTRFGRSLRVSMDDGADEIRLDDGVLRGRTRLLTGDGDDRVELVRQGVLESAPVVLRTGRDADVVHIQGCTFQTGVRVLTVQGEDDVTVLSSHFEKGLFLDTGEDQDAAHLEDSSLDGAFKMVGGSISATSGSTGSATLVIINVTFGVRDDGDDKFSWSFVIVHRFP